MREGRKDSESTTPGQGRLAGKRGDSSCFHSCRQLNGVGRESLINWNQVLLINRGP